MVFLLSGLCVPLRALCGYLPLPMNEPFRLARQAMKCRFEVLLFGSDRRRLRSVAQEALDEVVALDRQLNFFSPSSEISRINRLAGRRPVQVEPLLFDLLCRARQIWKATQGAFDPTIGPLLEIWGWTSRRGRIPAPAEIRHALGHVGMQRVKLDALKRTIRFEHPGMSLNLGAIGKGYALDRVAEILREHGIDRALAHGGTSSVCALGVPPDESSWKIALADPRDPQRSLGSIALRDQCLGVSSNHLQTLEAAGRRYGHVLDPCSGHPVADACLTAAACPSAADADAFSTALLCCPSAEWSQENLGLIVYRLG